MTCFFAVNSIKEHFFQVHGLRGNRESSKSSVRGPFKKVIATFKSEIRISKPLAQTWHRRTEFYSFRFQIIMAVTQSFHQIAPGRAETISIFEYQMTKTLQQVTPNESGIWVIFFILNLGF